MKALDLVGQKFEMLTVIERAKSNRYSPNASQHSVSHSTWHCRCDCGKETTVETQRLRSGHTTSCGCRAGQAVKAGRRFGALTLETPLGSRKWIARCDCGNTIRTDDQNVRKKHSCGCHRSGKPHPGSTHNLSRSREYCSWNGAKQRCYNKKSPKFKDYGERGIRMCKRWLSSFAAFYSDMGPKPSGTTLDRINNDGDYEPGNCRWATPKTQSLNRRYSLRVGQLSIKEVAARRGINYYTLRAAFKRGENPLTFVPRKCG